MQGMQPMFSYDNQVAVTFNGEIYGFKKLRNFLEKKGYQFRSTSDTEVILKGYAEYKEKVLDKMEGIFAFCVYNKKTKELFLARDRFGIKPLYYTKQGDNFVFASMLRAILKSEVVKPVLSKKALRRDSCTSVLRKNSEVEYLQE